MDPELVYIHAPGNDAPLVPMVDMQSEEYAVGKLAKRLFGKHMSEELFGIQARRSNVTTYSRDEFQTVVECYIERVINGSRRDRKDSGGLAHIVTKFSETYKFPIPYNYYRREYGATDRTYD